MYACEFGHAFRGKLPPTSGLLLFNKVGKILTMPKNRDYISDLHKKRNLLKTKTSSEGPASVCYLQFLGSGAVGAPKSLYFFSDKKRFIFNVGEGTQRIAHEHKVKIARMEHVFITYPIWENIGGLPGLCLTLQECGVPNLTVHGPKGLSSIFEATKRFVVLNHLNIQSVICDKSKSYEDGTVTINYVPLISKNAIFSTGDSTSLADIIGDIESIKDEIDYYAHLKSTDDTCVRDTSSVSNAAQLCSDVLSVSSPVSMAYICSLAPKAGALNLEKCVDMRVPPGPLLGKLKNGEDVTLSDGTIVKSVDVCAPDEEGPSFIIIDCPTIDFIDSLIEEESFRKFQTEKSDLYLMYVIHFTPADVMNDERYQAWMQNFPKETLHINANDKNKCLGCVSVHDIQFKLNLLDSKVFPLLKDNSIPEFHSKRFENNMLENILETAKKNAVSDTSFDSQFVRRAALNLPDDCIHTLRIFPLRPRDYVERHVPDCVYLDQQSSVKEIMMIPKMEEELNSLKTKIDRLKPTIDAIQQERPYPIITFLGTGSCVPNKYRSTSAILVSLSEDNHLLMDCSEGTFGQLIRHFGFKRAEEILANLNIIYISHLHADHHIGLINVLQNRRKVTKKHSKACNKVLLLAPKPILFWLANYHQQFEEIFDCMEFISNSDLEYRSRFDPSIEKILKVAPIQNIVTSYVIHCPQAFGVSFTHANGCKITYSGDTMPSKDLINIGKNSDLLVHEATFEDSLLSEAKLKFHSTTSQALDVGKQMEAKFVLLTHFSQRYAKLPLITHDFIENVGIAFDNMEISLSDLPKLFLYYPVLQLMFEEDIELIQLKGTKRKLSINN